ncbi:MAG: hypothetical protein PHU97_02615 [Bacteroidales bacterium]|nr:hypothetical protein [Bacteroidales bacterium]MDY0285920.1 hypothetical protein [Bacteroidales bacterium]HPE57641.1 hypothetical protein [Bacteroidales bacterium]
MKTPAVRIAFLLFPFLCSSCSEEQKLDEFTYINTSHLEHLYEELIIGTDTLGAVWIYCDAPDYQVVTDDDEGFTCVDDVARALVFYCRSYNKNATQEKHEKINQMLAFLRHMQGYNNYFYNFMFPNEAINTLHPNSVAGKNFWSWRACWALSEVCLTTDPDLESLRSLAAASLEMLIPKIIAIADEYPGVESFDGVQIPALAAHYGSDQLALMTVVLSNYYSYVGANEILNTIEKMGEILTGTRITDTIAERFAFLSWKNTWHAWGNAQSYALLCAGEVTGRGDFNEAAIEEITNFYPYILDAGLTGFSAKKENGILSTFDQRYYPQIAYALRPMVFAAVKAWEITGESRFAEIAADAGSWYLGNNPAGKAMYDTLTGRCFDGIDGPASVNYNSGAESTIEALLALQCIESAEVPFQKLRNKTGD